jgi:hypothetical protein
VSPLSASIAATGSSPPSQQQQHNASPGRVPFIQSINRSIINQSSNQCQRQPARSVGPQPARWESSLAKACEYIEVGSCGVVALYKRTLRVRVALAFALRCPAAVEVFPVVEVVSAVAEGTQFRRPGNGGCAQRGTARITTDPATRTPINRTRTQTQQCRDSISISISMGAEGARAGGGEVR